MATKYPPQVSLSESIRIIKDVYKIHKTTEISEDLLPEIIKVSPKSSYFRKTIIALGKFGLVERLTNGIVKFTDLAMQIIKPFGNEDQEAKLYAARHEELLSQLIDKYPNYVLPSPEQTQQTLIRQFNIDRDTVEKWYQFVADSFRELKSSGNYNNSWDEIVPLTNEKCEVIEKRQVRNTSTGELEGIKTDNNYTINLPVADGGTISISIPQSANQKDLKRMKAVIDALIENDEG